MSKVYPIGYTAPGSSSIVEALMSNPSTLLIDTRFSPKSRLPEWTGSALSVKYGVRYREAGNYLGNINYKGGPIRLARPDSGIRGLERYLGEEHDLILLCGCANYETCHRKVIVEMLLQRNPAIEVIQPDAVQTTDTVMCLSVRQPWSWLLVNGHKDVENREWSTNYRGPLLIHAGARVDEDWFYPKRHPESGMLYGTMADRYTMRDIMPVHQSLYTTGAIVGVADLVDVVTESDSRWFCGTYGFVLENARAFETTIPWRGALKLFPVTVCHLCEMPVTESDSEVVGDRQKSYRLCFDCIK